MSDCFSCVLNFHANRQNRLNFINGFYHSILSSIQCHYKVILSLLNERDRYLRMYIGGVEAFFYYKHLNTYNSQSSLASKQIPVWVMSMTKKILPTTYSIVGWKLNSFTPNIQSKEIDIYRWISVGWKLFSTTNTWIRITVNLLWHPNRFRFWLGQWPKKFCPQLTRLWGGSWILLLHLYIKETNLTADSF